MKSGLRLIAVLVAVAIVLLLISCNTGGDDPTETGGETFNFFGDFEAGIGSWYADNGMWEVGTPTSGPSTAYSGSKVAATVLNGNYPGNDSRLISPSIVLPSIGPAEEIHLRFWHWFHLASGFYNGATRYDLGEASISEELSPGVWSGWSILASYSGSSGGVWTNPVVDLSAYAARKVRVGFNLNNYDTYPIGSSDGWYIDDVSIAVW